MKANIIESLFWNIMGDQGTATTNDLITEARNRGADPKKVEAQVFSILRDLNAKDLITDQADSSGERFWKLTKKGSKKVRDAEKSLDRPAHGDTYEVETVIRLTLPSLAGSIPADSAEEGRLEWPREDGKIVLYPVWFKGMFRKVFERMGNVDRYVADWLMFDPVRLDAGVETKLIKIPVPPDRPGSAGKGVNVFEALPTGTTITVRSVFPGKVVPRDKVESFWRYAGRVGFSVGKSKLGYGTFEVIECATFQTLTLNSSQAAAD